MRVIFALALLISSTALAESVAIPVQAITLNAFNEGFNGARIIVKSKGEKALVRLDLWKSGPTRDHMAGVTFYPVDVAVDGLTYSKEAGTVKFEDRSGRSVVCVKVKGKGIFREYTDTGLCAVKSTVETREIGEGWDRQTVKDIAVTLVVEL